MGGKCLRHSGRSVRRRHAAVPDFRTARARRHLGARAVLLRAWPFKYRAWKSENGDDDGDPDARVSGGSGRSRGREFLEVIYSRVIVAVQGVSLKVPDNSIVALLGTNGAGKSTTVRAISGFLPVDDADIRKGTDPLRWRSSGCRPTQVARAASCWCPTAQDFRDTHGRGELADRAGRSGTGALAAAVERLFEIFPSLA